MRRIPLRQKASRRDAQIGQVLWRKDHGGWGAVTAVVPSPQGLKVHYRDVDGQPGKGLLDALYRQID